MSHNHDHKHDGHDCCGHDHHDHSAEEKAHDHKHDHAGCCGHDHVHDESCGHDVAEDAEWTRRFFVMLQAVVLIMIGGVMCYFVTAGRIDAYVTGWFRTLALCGGLGIMVMGIFNWIMRGKQVACGHDHGAGEACEHDHGHGKDAPAHEHHHEGSVLGRALTLLVLSGSVAAAAMMTPDRFSSRYLLNKADAYRGDSGSEQRRAENNPALAAARAATEPAAAQAGGGLTLAKIEQYVKRTKDGNFPLSVVNLHYMSGDPEYADVMEGQGIETTGQVVKDQVNPGPGHLRVVTMVVTCCAADARPYSIPVVFDGPVPDYVEMGWYEITGKLEFTRERGMKIAQIKAKDLKATARPADQRPGM
jgi:uncharacterized repeat protein (TIGR03943 family)